MKMFSLFCSFMKDFKRKGSLSLIEELKTHSKFPLIGTFLETLTGSSKEVQHHMIFARCLLFSTNVFYYLFSRGMCKCWEVSRSRAFMAFSVTYVDQTLLLSFETWARSKILWHWITKTHKLCMYFISSCMKIINVHPTTLRWSK